MGRPWAYALGAGGQQGVKRMLDTLRAELEVAMTLTGCSSIQQAGRELLDSY
ncbi:MAG: alpha-hydroxy-acid oxidizing protein [Povalibacter sp.]